MIDNARRWCVTQCDGCDWFSGFDTWMGPELVVIKIIFSVSLGLGLEVGARIPNLDTGGAALRE